MALKDKRFVQCHADNILFTLNNGNKFVAVLIYVDYILVTGTHPSNIQDVIQFLSTGFKVKDLGVLKYILEIQVARSIDGIYMHQHK